MAWIKYNGGLINLDQVTDIEVAETSPNGGQTTFNLTNGESIAFGTVASIKEDAMLAMVRLTRAVDSEVYDTRNYEEE